MKNKTDKKEQIKNIENGKGIKHIIDEACKILGNPILVHDMEYKVIAYTENNVADDPIWNEFKLAGMVGRDRLIFYRDECFFEMAANAKKITFLLSDKLKYDRIFGKIFTKNNIQVGCVCMVACYKSFEKEDTEFFEIVCDSISNEICNSEFYNQYGQNYIESLISKLIENRLEDKSLYTAHVEAIYIGLKSNMHLIVADTKNFTYDKLEYFRNLLNQIRPDFKYAIYNNYILIITSSDNIKINVKRDFKGLYDFFEQNNIHTGVSSCFENLFDLSKYYNEAVKNLNNELDNKKA